MNRKKWRICTAVLVVAGSVVAEDSGRLVIWDNKPAKKWEVAYPVGNGRLGAMPFGLYPSEKILINEETIWARSEDFHMPENSFEHLERLRNWKPQATTRVPIPISRTTFRTEKKRIVISSSTG